MNNDINTLKQEFDNTPAMHANIVGDTLIVHIDMMKAFPMQWGVYWPDENGDDTGDIRQLYSDGLTIWYDDYDGDRREITEKEAKSILETPVRNPGRESAPKLSLTTKDPTTWTMLNLAMECDYLTNAGGHDVPHVRLVWDFFATIMANASMLVACVKNA